MAYTEKLNLVVSLDLHITLVMDGNGSFQLFETPCQNLLGSPPEIFHLFGQRTGLAKGMMY